MQDPPAIIVVNGTERTITPGTTLRALIELLGLAGQPVAAEVNRAVVPFRQHPATTLRHGDRVELVTLVGGG
ncbi:MAG: sulfur carrier protein ThiS [Phycisphaerales bacterium]